MITLDRFILEEERQHPGATGELSMLLMRFGVAGKRIAWELSVGGLRNDLGAAGSTNVQGEEQQKLDVLANQILLETFDYGGLVSIAASEEMTEPFIYERNAEQGRYAILFDPMDGSSNIGVNGTLGTIFSVRQRGRGEVDLLQSGREQVAAGYILFGPATLLVYTCGEDVRLFTLEPSIGEFLLTSSSVRMPPRGRGYAVNEGRSGAWAPETRAFVEYLKQSDEAAGRPYSTRYSASLVADFHRILLEGGIYLYPATAGKPTGKLRVLYECHPLAYVAEHAGGGATTGREAVLDVVPDSLHARIPFAIGSAREIALYDRFQSGRGPD
jgi:fructose-1,6-bisphosphatase I